MTTQSDILTLIARNPLGASRSELAEALGANHRSVEGHLCRLKHGGFIECTSRGCHARWIATGKAYTARPSRDRRFGPFALSDAWQVPGRLWRAMR
jgi:hypothetical protein